MTTKINNLSSAKKALKKRKPYEFKKGDIIKLIKAEGINAPSGSLAIITKTKYKVKWGTFIDIEWKTPNSHGQTNGGYYPEQFKLIK